MDPRTRPKPGGGARVRERTVTYLFVAMEVGRVVEGSARLSLDDLDVVVIGRGATRHATRTIDDDTITLRLDVPDPWMSQVHARIVREGDGWTVTDAGSRNGSLVNEARVGSAVLHDGDILELGGTLFLFRTALPDSGGDILMPSPTDLIRTVHPGLAQRLADLSRLAVTDVPVVLQGPSGAGKEIIARGVHSTSGRRGAFVAVNCGAIPAGLVESELFGYRRGAFSGANTDKLGLIAAADRGTLFLDEIGDLPAQMQPALLRALQERAVTPVGSTTPMPVDFRLISATHRDLAAMVAAGAFRLDLWTRLAGFTVELPSLHARREDLATLVADLGERLRPGRGLVFTADAARALLHHNWAGNVRELEKVLAAALVLAGDGDIDIVHLPPGVASSSGTPAHTPLETRIDPVRVDDPRREELIAALRAHHGNVSAAARAMDRPRSQIQRWMRRWGLRPSDFGA